ncbi:uncharacterized protein LOC132733245 isoform X1 [Ruditapes philippinarum]|uniref:uncharacterized protein LOC132733245 isoform X1 n=1 Tax=Ruditapes philippinarum TaxID=129788 RepID=UPI00295B685E|nr:uncharacterized protein LOC132733245 isoform X1 [Ruditapes philippinarum]
MTDTEKKLSLVNKKTKWHIRNPFKSKDVVSSGNDWQLKQENDQLKQEIEDLRKLRVDDIYQLEREEIKNMELLLRLSKLEGEKLTKDDPAITDLSDTNHPTKVGEVYRELHDNEWTDALQGLTGAGHDDEEATATLYLTLLNIYDFCKKKAGTLLDKIDDTVNYLFEEYKRLQEHPDANETSVTTMPMKRVSNIRNSEISEDSINENFELNERWRYKTGHESYTKSFRASLAFQGSETILDKLKVFQKEVAETMVPVVQKAYIKASWTEDDFVPALKPFIRKCIYVCWMMLVQSLPMCIHVIDVNEQDTFDKNLYKEYTNSGPYIKYIVWPAMLLHENGPVVCKGIAQGCDSDSKPNNENVSTC